MIDILIVTVPPLEFYLPPAAPAILKGHLKDNGFTASTIDLNLAARDFLGKHSEEYKDFFDFTVGSSNNDSPIVEKVFEHWLSLIQEHEFEFLGISVFSDNNCPVAEHFIRWLRFKDLRNPIIVGGQGASHHGFQGRMSLLVDYFITGEGEKALVELLKGNTKYPGINSAPTQIDDLDSLGLADYSDYSLSNYDMFYQTEVVQITGSRGCVRSCSFCNIPKFWPKFRWRSGKHIANEIMKTHQEQGVRNFYFTDSLINGNMKCYMEMCELLAKYNSTLDEKIMWGGQQIVKQRKTMPKDYFKLTAESGAYNLALGVESGSDRVLEHMDKKFTRADLDFFIEGCSEHGVTAGYMFIFGYPTETQEDFEQTLEIFRDHAPFVADGTVTGATIGSTMMILRGTPLEGSDTYITDLTVKGNEYNPLNDEEWERALMNWRSSTVPDLDLYERMRRNLVAQKVAESYGWSLISRNRELRNLYNILRDQWQ